MARNRLLTILLLLLSLPALTACWDRRDPEKVAWVSAIGIDKGPHNDYLVTFQIPIARQAGPVGGGAQTGQRGSNINTVTVQAPDLVSAMTTTQSFVSRRLTLAHAKGIVLGESLSAEEIRRVLHASMRFVEFRRSMLVMVSHQGARDFLELLHPVLETGPARWFEQLQTAQVDTGNVPMTTLHELLLELEQPGVGARATLVGIRTAESPGPVLGKESNPTEEPPDSTNVLPGGVRRAGTLQVEVIGAAVIKGTQVHRYLTGRDYRQLTALRGEMKRVVANMDDPIATGNRISFVVSQRRQPRVEVSRQGNQVRVHFDLDFSAQMQSQESTINYADLERHRFLEEEMARELAKAYKSLLDKALKEWEVDLFRIGHRLKRTFPTYEDWVRWDWASHIAQAKSTVSVTFRIERSGLLVSSPPVSR